MKSNCNVVVQPVRFLVKSLDLRPSTIPDHPSCTSTVTTLSSRRFLIHSLRVTKRSSNFKIYISEIEDCEDSFREQANLKMVDEALPASLEKLEIDGDAANSSRINSADKSNALNPFRTTTKGLISDTSYLFRRRSMPNRPASCGISPRGVKSTTNFKPSKNERVLEKPRKNSIIKEAVLKLNGSNTSSNYLSENLASTLLEEACKLSISSKTNKTFGRGSVTKDFKALNISPDSRLVKDDASIEQDSFNTSSFQRVRSNTMPSLKRGPGPGGGTTSTAGQTDVQNSSVASQNSNSSTCSIQARISPPPCDVTIDELASYFDEFVHIPKKMSHMAEMMYI